MHNDYLGKHIVAGRFVAFIKRSKYSSELKTGIVLCTTPKRVKVAYKMPHTIREQTFDPEKMILIDESNVWQKLALELRNHFHGISQSN